MIRRKIIAFCIVVIFILTLMISMSGEPISSSKDLFHFYVNSYDTQFGGDNAVTAIYLGYRLFDTFFETILLVLSVIGIIYFSRHEGEY